MQKPSPASALDAVFGALSDPTRRGIVARLVHGECSVTALASPFAVTAPAISKHLRVLENAGLIHRRKRGRVHYCRLRAEPLREAEGWMEQQREFWERQFDALTDFFEKEQGECNQPLPNGQESPSGSSGASKGPAKPSFGRGRIRKS